MAGTTRTTKPKTAAKTKTAKPKTAAKTKTAAKPKTAKPSTAKKPKTAKPSTSAKPRLTLQQQANEILKQAEERGVNSNFFFATTFKRYQVQMKILTDLEKAITEHGMIISKEYVKGRQNLVTNPAITEYNKTATAANGTVSTLINIIKTLSNEPDAVDALSEFLKDNG